MQYDLLLTDEGKRLRDDEEAKHESSERHRHGGVAEISDEAPNRRQCCSRCAPEWARNQDQYRLRNKSATPLLAAGRAELADGDEAQA